MSALDIIDTIDYFNKNYNIDNFTINQCSMGHTYLRCRNLSDANKQLVKDQLEQAKLKYFDNLNLVGSFNNCLTEIAQHRTESYIDYFNKIDQLEGTQFGNIFPELV